MIIVGIFFQITLNDRTLVALTGIVVKSDNI